MINVNRLNSSIKRENFMIVNVNRDIYYLKKAQLRQK